jgi:CHAT domain-containing protein
MYSRRLADTFGSGSPQYAEAIDLKERCRFEDTVDGHIKAFRITLATPGTALYEQFCREYEEAYVEWKGDGGNKPLVLKADDYRVYDVPHTLEIMKNRNYQTVADSCQWAINKIDNMLKARDSERDEKPSIDYLRKLMAIWALCADSSGRRSEVVTQAQSWYRLLLEHGIWNSKSNLLQMLATAKISGDAKDYDRLEASVADTIRDSRDELRAATLLQALYQLCDGVYLFLYNNTLRCSLLAELDQTLQQLKSADSSTYAKYLLLRTGLVARNIWEFGVTASSNKESLTAVLELLEKETDLHVFSESHGVVSLLCGEFFSLNDYESVVRSDRLRKKIAKVCDSDTKRRQKESLFSFNLHWQSFSPLGKDFELQAIYTNLAYGDADKLEEHIQLAYNLQNEKSEITSTEQQEALLAQWNDIRSQQRNAFSDDEKLVKKIEDMTTQACRYLERQNVSDTICGMAYNIALFGKGYLLRSHQQLRHVISESGNRTVLRDLDEYIRLEQLLDNSSLSQAKAEEMTAKANDLWQKLRSASTSFDDYSKSLEADWHDVRNALAPDELAIEYVCTNDILKKYYALILRKDYEAPLVLGLSYESTYTENPDTMFTQEGRYRSPWPYYVDVEGKYVHPFEGIRRVYVSPTGVLHKLPLESLHDLYTDSIMSDKFEIYRVTSTRELIGHHRQRPVIKAQLYGGVTYSMDDNQWQLLAATKDSGHKLLTAMRDVPKLSRGAVSEALQPLEGTEREVREIAAMLGASSDDVTCLTGADATEDNLKSLSGSGVTVLHIATHGFYQTIDEASDSLSVTFARSSDKQEANALSRSGLFMAGAAAVFSGDPIPDNVDDGVLTAREISHLDLTSLDMLALSACETALGDTSGEGVFGLQRGFKKAGAQSILMSLWKVDDEATCLLMTEFYKHWIGEGKTKHDALELAKQTVRSHKEKGWDNPEYWAAFILLDGLE